MEHENDGDLDSSILRYLYYFRFKKYADQKAFSGSVYRGSGDLAPDSEGSGSRKFLGGHRFWRPSAGFFLGYPGVYGVWGCAGDHGLCSITGICESIFFIFPGTVFFRILVSDPVNIQESGAKRTVSFYPFFAGGSDLPNGFLKEKGGRGRYGKK